MLEMFLETTLAFIIAGGICTVAVVLGALMWILLQLAML